MAQSRFSAFLQSVRFLIHGSPTTVLEGHLSHQFSTDATPIGVLSHEFTLGAISTSGLQHQFNVAGIGGFSPFLQHQFNINFIDTSARLPHQLNVNTISATKILSHQFGMTTASGSTLSHTFGTGFAGSGLLNHQFGIVELNKTLKLEHQFNVDSISKVQTLSHAFALTGQNESLLSHQFTIANAGEFTLSHQMNVPGIINIGTLPHTFNVDTLFKDAPLNHQFGVTGNTSATLSHSFGVLSAVVESILSHQFNIFAIVRTQTLAHQFNINTLLDKKSVLSHQFGMALGTTSNLSHDFSVAWDAVFGISHEFNLDTLFKNKILSHEFQINVNKTKLSHEFSAIGAGITAALLGHEFAVDYVAPSNYLAHNFNLHFDLPLPPVTTHASQIVDIFDSTISGVTDFINQYNHSGVRAYSYSDTAYSSPTSTGSWFGVPTTGLISSVMSGLSEGDYFHGTFVFHNQQHTTSGIAYVPELDANTTYLRQSWLAPVVESGNTAYRGLREWNAAIELTLTPGQSPFPPFFGRQLAISGLASDYWNDYPLEITSVSLSDQDGDPFKFHFYQASGDTRAVLERDFFIEGIYVGKPIGGNPARGDTTVRLGFTGYEQNYQPEELTFSIGIDTPPDVFTQNITTDQWLAQGQYRDFNITALRNGDLLRGQISAISPAENVEFNGVYPPQLLAMSSDDLVNLWGGSTLVWPDILSSESILDIEYLVSGLSRNRLPALLTYRYEDLNSQPKVIMFNTESENLTASVYLPSVSLKDGDQLEGLEVLTDLTKTITNAPVSSSFALFKKKNKNTTGKIIFLTEED